MWTWTDVTAGSQRNESFESFYSAESLHWKRKVLSWRFDTTVGCQSNEKNLIIMTSLAVDSMPSQRKMSTDPSESLVKSSGTLGREHVSAVHTWTPSIDYRPDLLVSFQTRDAWPRLSGASGTSIKLLAAHAGVFSPVKPIDYPFNDGLQTLSMSFLSSCSYSTKSKSCDTYISIYIYALSRSVSISTVANTKQFDKGMTADANDDALSVCFCVRYKEVCRSYFRL